MALSFEESKRLAADSACSGLPSDDSVCDNDVMTFDLNDVADMRAVVDSNFNRSDKYVWIDDYDDTVYSKIDAARNITVDPSQADVTQEDNGQIVPFEMPRYYDGIDLMEMTIQIHYLNANHQENYAAPINVTYSSDKIRFGWLLSNNATAKDGTLNFELMASGAVTIPNTGTTKTYLWRSRPNGKLNVVKALSGVAMDDPTGDDWYTSFLATMTQKVGEAQAAADMAKQSAAEAKNIVSNLSTTLANYYTKEEVDGFLEVIRNDGLANFDVQYNADSQTLKFMNGEKLIKTITLSTDPSVDWVTSYNKTVEAKIEEKLTPVKSEITETKNTLDGLKAEIGDLPTTLQTDYYNKTATNKLLESKAEKASVETVSNDLTVVKNTASGLQNSIDTINSDISDIQEQLKNVKPDSNAGREYDITYEDTGIAGNSLDTGTYVVQVSGFNSSYTQLYSEIYSGVMSWYSGTTNSGNSSEIFLHNAGLADNNNAIYLRTLRVAGSKTLKLQIACKVAATGTDILTFKFRRLI